MILNVGVVIADRGAAIVSVEHDELARLVTGIERLPSNLAAVADRLREIAPETRVIIDSAGLGGALWRVVGPQDDPEGWQLYSGKGIERQALVDELLVAIEEDRFRFAPNLLEQEAMSRALQGYRRHVREDGLIGSELVVALLLAMIPQPPPRADWMPMVSWGASALGASDDFDGTTIGSTTYRRGPDGVLVGVTQEPEEMP